MNIVFLHYHLNHGGVTRVIANQIRALTLTFADPAHLRIGLLSGGQMDSWAEEQSSLPQVAEFRVGSLPRLQYDSHSRAEPNELAAALRGQLSEFGFRHEDTVLHVHNHSLGKNASLPGALRILAAEGYALLLQLHDFAEDHRPTNYCHLLDAWDHGGMAHPLYPQATNIHYAVLNSRDYSLLWQAGTPADRLHYLPNSMPSMPRLPDQAEARRRLFNRFGVPRSGSFLAYPVRAIRRKNLGEALLWSALFPSDVHIGITLPPVNPAARPHYERWKQLAAELPLPVHFELGGANGLPVRDVLAAADLILTTSVAEGFGMVFLESWMSERVLVGRNLPEITADFVAAGMRFDHLYDRLRIPVALVGRPAVEEMLRAAYCHLFNAYRLPTPQSSLLSQLLNERTHDDLVDFADLDESLQEHVLRRVVASPPLRQEILDLNPVLARVFDTPTVERQNLICVNKRVVHRSYCPAVSGARLCRIYEKLLTQPRDGCVTDLGPNNGLLTYFLTPHRFRPMKG